MDNLRHLLRHDPAAALRAAQRQPADAGQSRGETAFIAGAALRLLGREIEAERQLRSALQIAPDHRDASLALAHLLRDQGRYAAAAQVVKAFFAALPHNSALVASLIVFLRECQQHRTAEDIWRAAFAESASAGHWYLGGELSLALGEFDVARERFDRCLALEPSHAAALLRRAHTGVVEDPDPFPAMLESLQRARNRLPPTSRIALDFANGKLCLDRGEVAPAFAYFDRGNREQRECAPWDRAAWESFVESCLRDQTGLPPPDTRGEEAVLIIGLPRSGTTLLATRLGQHPEIADRGELPWLELLAQGKIPVEMYLRHLRQDDAPRRYYLDKNPLNFCHLDAIARELPRARIIHCRRDPRDVAVSCYTQHFAHAGMAWTYGWQDILAFQRGYQRLVERPPRLATTWMDVDYADLVTEPEAELRRVIGFLDLSWNEAVLDAASEVPLRTASVWQARQPLHARSLGRWRAFSAHVAPLLSAYGDQAAPVGWSQPASPSV